MTERCTRLPRALLAACTLAVAVLALPGCSYNRFTSGEEAIKGAWGDVQNQLMRRNDLIPNLVETVKGNRPLRAVDPEQPYPARASRARADRCRRHRPVAAGDV